MVNSGSGTFLLDLKSGSTVKVQGVNEHTSVPNHHANYPGFSGLAGLIAALSMIIGRDGDARLAVGLSGVGAGDVVVDIGCGPGVAARHAARLGASVTGVDPAPIMVRVARLLTRNSEQVRYVDGTAEALPGPDDSASAVWSIATVHHWSDLDAGIQEARRVLRSGGRLVAIERQTRPGAHGHASHGWTDAQADAFADRCRAHGLIDVRVERNTSGRRSTVSVIATTTETAKRLQPSSSSCRSERRGQHTQAFTSPPQPG
jgi:ubiquinone/menaquinone biosynthesis C-methylase UbiE